MIVESMFVVGGEEREKEKERGRACYLLLMPIYNEILKPSSANTTPMSNTNQTYFCLDIIWILILICWIQEPH